MKNHYVKNTKNWISQRLSWLLILSCFPLLAAFSQNRVKLDLPQIFPVSPTTAIMDKFQSYPVDYCTGVPEINIPLYEIVAGDITIPVTLSYHGSGLKPQEGSGLIGTNWSLSLEPSVSREVRGKDDRGNYGWLQDGSYHRGVPPTLPGMDQINFMDEVVSGIRDSRPDRFTYKLPHGGGSGYMLYRGSPMVTCPRTNDVVRWEDYDKMTITDDKGFYYEFDGAVEKLVRVSSDTPQLINRWLCTSIRSPHKSEASVTFSYDKLPHRLSGTNKGGMGRGEVIISTPETEDAYYLTEHYPGQSSSYAILPDRYSGSDAYFYDYKAMLSPDYSGSIEIDYSSSSGTPSNEMEVSQLTDIHFMGNTMRVHYKSVGESGFTSEVYDRLEVIDEKGKLVRSIRFYISTYHSYTNLTKLDSVSISAPGVETRTYTFNYNGGRNVPSTYTTAIDHWGFCNGSETYYTEKTVPNFRKILYYNDGGTQKRMLLNYQGADREADSDWTNLGMLIQITDPEGLETHFEYEGNYAAFSCGTYDPQTEGEKYLRPVGGLRVKHIRTYDPKTQKTIHKEYSYGLEESIGHGVIWGGGVIPHIVTERDYQTNIFLATESNYLRPLTIYHNMPVSEITFHNGSSVLYSNVRERVEGAGEVLETLYIYYVPFHRYSGVLEWDIYDFDYNKKESRVNDILLTRSFSELEGLVCPIPNNPGKHSDEYSNLSDPNWLAGKLARVERYKSGNFLLSTTQYEYDRVWAGPVVSIEIPVRRISVSPDICWNNPGQYSWDNIFVTDRFYPPTDGGAAQSTFYLDIGSYTFLEREYTWENRGEKAHEYEEYNMNKTFEYEFTSEGMASLEPRRIKTVRSDGSLTIDEYDYLDGQFPGILSKHRHTEGNSWQENRILFKEGTSLPHKIVSATDQQPDFRDEVVYTAYDRYNNVVEVQGKDGVPTTYLWGYRSRFPVAMLTNASRAEVLAIIGKDAESKLDAWAEKPAPFAEMWQTIETLRTSLPNANVYTCEYEPLQGVVAITDPNKITTRHEYDGFNRLIGSYYLDTNANKVLLQRYLYHFGEK